MTLLIAFLLIKGFGLNWGWYSAALIVWVMRLATHKESK